MIPCAYDSMLRYAEYKLDLRELYIKCQIRLIFGILYMFLSRFLLKKTGHSDAWEISFR